MDWKDVPPWLSAASGVVSALGVVLVFFQLRLAKRLAQSQFEDSLAREYRELAAKLPTKALLGQALTEDEYLSSTDELFRYFDLSNEQVFLRQRKRVSFSTWQNWCSGIRSNLKRPAFARAWEELKTGCTSFEELRRLETESFESDPARW
jgi:hypothetical protein